jgi:hypothetical protein
MIIPYIVVVTETRVRPSSVSLQGFYVWDLRSEASDLGMECPLLREVRTDMWRKLWSRNVPGTLSFIQKPKEALPVEEFMLKTGLLPPLQVVDPVATGSTQEQDNNAD